MSDVIRKASAVAMFGILFALIFNFPTSPFVDMHENMPSSLKVVLGYVNYYLPMRTLLGMLGLWLGAVGTYVGWSVAIKFLKSVI